MKKINFTGILFLITSFLILIAGFIIPNRNIAYSILEVSAIISLIILDIKAPNILNLSEENPKIKTFRFLVRLSIFIMILCSIMTILSPIEKLTISKNTDILIIASISMFMMIFGNLSTKIPFNRYLGLRLPWTIRDEQTWRIAHKIVGYLSFPIALVMLISSFFISSDIIAPISILTWVIIPSIYSFIFYYKKIKGLNK